VRILIAGGGTGGHVYPGISVANEFREQKQDHRILFVGTRKGMEAELIPKAGYAIETITVSGFQRKLSLTLLKNLADAIQGFFQAGRIMARFQPDIVIGTGGYVCGPVVSIARLRGIPTMILEQNVIPGVTNRILGRFVNGVAVTYEASKRYFPQHQKVRVTGNPIRRDIMSADPINGRKVLNLDLETKVVMSFGGSIGAQSINRAMAELAGIWQARPDVHLLIVTGRDKLAETVGMLKEQGIQTDEAGNVSVKPYLYNIQDAYAAADIIVGRAGGISLSELTALGKAAIIVPYPHATNQHQAHNAQTLAEAGAALVISDQKLSGTVLDRELNNLLNNPQQLADMARRSKELGRPDAAAQIAAWAKQLVTGNKRRKT
jgi:UDP-N-acetylglucosamine--N-acetylmuramyl-(pentapeptide) pyrophosphoryl-undecaprenol N-acetylglucosamine transferase